MPAEKRTADEKTQLSNYYKTVDPQVGAEASRLDAIRNDARYGELVRRLRLESTAV